MLCKLGDKIRCREELEVLFEVLGVVGVECDLSSEVFDGDQAAELP